MVTWDEGVTIATTDQSQPGDLSLIGSERSRKRFSFLTFPDLRAVTSGRKGGYRYRFSPSGPCSYRVSAISLFCPRGCTGKLLFFRKYRATTLSGHCAMAAYKLVLIRHGESCWNQENRFCGWFDADLSDTGIHEAKRGGQALKGKQQTNHRTLKQCYARSLHGDGFQFGP